MPSILKKSTGILLAGILSTFAFSPASAQAASPAFDEVRQNDIGRQFSLSALDVGDPMPSGMNGHASYGYYPGGMNKAEFDFCKWPINMPACASAKSAADDALKRAQQKFPAQSLYQGKGDAYRHCYWSARMTREIGESAAQGFGDRHESETPEGADKSMDLRNNATGRSVGKRSRSNDAASKACEYMANNGQLVTIK